MFRKLSATIVLTAMATSMSDAYNHKDAPSSPPKVSEITLCAPVNISGFDPSDAADIFWSGYLAGATNLFSNQGFISNYDYGARTTIGELLPGSCPNRPIPIPDFEDTLGTFTSTCSQGAFQTFVETYNCTTTAGQLATCPSYGNATEVRQFCQRQNEDFGDKAICHGTISLKNSDNGKKFKHSGSTIDYDYPMDISYQAYSGSFFNSSTVKTVTCSYLPIPVAGEGRVTGGTGKYMKNAQNIIESIETDVVPVNIPPPTDANFNFFSTSSTTFASFQLDPLEWHEEITITYAKKGPNTGLLR